MPRASRSKADAAPADEVMAYLDDNFVSELHAGVNGSAIIKMNESFQAYTENSECAKCLGAIIAAMGWPCEAGKEGSHALQTLLQGLEAKYDGEW